MTPTGDMYICILTVHLHLFMSIVNSNGLGKFQKDNVIPHTSRIVTELLQEHSFEFKHLC